MKTPQHWHTTSLHVKCRHMHTACTLALIPVHSYDGMYVQYIYVQYMDILSLYTYRESLKNVHSIHVWPYRQPVSMYMYIHRCLLYTLYVAMIMVHACCVYMYACVFTYNVQN